MIIIELMFASSTSSAEYSKSLSASKPGSKSGSRSTSQNLGAHIRKLDLGSNQAEEDASTGTSAVRVRVR